MTLQVKVRQSTDNPFYGLRHSLQLYNAAEKGQITSVMLDAAWNEVKANKEHRQMFFSLLFSIGDITARQHNIFRKNKVDTGGSANRETFRMISLWMKRMNYAQFVKFMFMRIFNEYVSFDVLFAMRIKTQKKTKKIVETVNMVGNDVKYLDDLSTFIVRVIQGNNVYDKHLVAKFLSRPRMSKRQKHRVMLPETRVIMQLRQDILRRVSEKLNFPMIVKEKYINFTGFYEWRKQFLDMTEATLFSSGAIKSFDQTQFMEWLNTQPAGARYRVRTRLLNKDNTKKPKWGEMAQWFLDWENFKEDKQKEVRVVEEKLRQLGVTRGAQVIADATELSGQEMDLKIQLEAAKKEAKVTVGAINFSEMFSQIIMGTVDKVKVQPFLDKIIMPYNTLVFVDDSSSMQSYAATDSKYGFTAYDFAAFMATICLLKNPDDTGRSLIGLFSSSTRMFTDITAIKRSTNRLMNIAPEEVSLPLVDPNMHFLDNLINMRAFLNAHRTGDMTNISSIPGYIHRWAAGDQGKLEQLQNFPVWTLITDGNWNNLYNPVSSLNDFMSKCERYLGFKPFVVAIDVGNSVVQADKFNGIENFMYLSPNPAQIEQFLTNFTDIDIVDVYTPLQSLFRSDRYAPVRENTL